MSCKLIEEITVEFPVSNIALLERTILELKWSFAWRTGNKEIAVLTPTNYFLIDVCREKAYLLNIQIDELETLRKHYNGEN